MLHCYSTSTSRGWVTVDALGEMWDAQAVTRFGVVGWVIVVALQVMEACVGGGESEDWGNGVGRQASVSNGFNWRD